MSHKQTGRWLLFLTVALVMGCNSDQVAAPSEVVSINPAMSDLFANDYCVTDPSWACHGEPVLFWYFSDATIPYGDPSFDCPDGCTTYPLAAGTRSKVSNILDFHIKSDSTCSWAKNFLRTAFNYSRIRWYDVNDGAYGDSHWSSTNPTTNDIHIYDSTFSDTHDLGMTLIHEAAHIHFDNVSDPFAEGWATQCYQP